MIIYLTSLLCIDTNETFALFFQQNTTFGGALIEQFTTSGSKHIEHLIDNSKLMFFFKKVMIMHLST